MKLFLIFLFLVNNCIKYKILKNNIINKLIIIILMGIGDWGLGIGDWGLGIGPNPQSPIPNPQSPIPNPHLMITNLNKSEEFII